MSSRDQLRAMLERAAGEARPVAPDWEGAAHIARRAARLRLVTATGAAVLAGGVLLGGGLAARAALDHEDGSGGTPAPAPGPAPTPPKPDGGTETGGGTETAPSVSRPDLVVSVESDTERGGVTVTTSNQGPISARPSVTRLDGNVRERTINVEALGPGQSQSTHVGCPQGETIGATADSGPDVDEAAENNNTAQGTCAPGPVDQEAR